MISMTLLGILGLLALFVLLALRMPVALSMLGVGFIGNRHRQRQQVHSGRHGL